MRKFSLLLACGYMGLLIHAQTNPCNPDGKSYSQFPADTTIMLSSGTTITFNRCEFFDVRDCLQIMEITDPQQLMRENVNMYDKDGNILITCGMIKIDMKDCGKECFEVPVKIRIRVRFPDCRDQPNTVPNLYFNSGNGWSEPKGTAASIITINNIRYLEFTTACPVKLINCDSPKKGRKVKFIAPKGNKVSRIRTGITCPLFYSDEKFVPKRKVKMRLLCSDPERSMLQSVQLSPGGDSIVTKATKLATLKHGRGRVNCKEPKRSIFGRLFGWLSPERGQYYRRYYLPST
jgi:hypothetical protein